ncbi:C40 family peptidase [Nocardia pseudovaccinii]|uniref:C40 family peptidase n=1 Tax=Nocardia pseudovaccinii TaxID=189540 RepID=UPI000B231894|nr:C40 family peptidase [Nocardia pseudovaccinii]
MDTSKTVIATAISLPIALILLLLMVVGVDSARSCAAPLANSAAAISGATGTSVVGLSERQLQLARNGVVIGKQRGMSQNMIIAELAAAATESTFRNLANPAVPESLNYSNDGLGYDHDSLGPHQMRASVWGSVGIATLMNPIYQINWFYDHAAQLGSAAAHMSPAELAQAIEQSAPNAYRAQLDLAQRLYAMFADIDTAPMHSRQDGSSPAGCGPNGSGTPLPAHASAFGRAVIEAAMKWIGTPYVWGGGDTTGPTGGGFDCSGLTLYAIYQASGGRIRLPHYTQAQQDHPSARSVLLADRAPGDLIFFTTPAGTDSHHVGIYYGRVYSGPDDKTGTEMLLHAPQAGQTVTLTPLSAWDEHADVRRYDVPATTSPLDTTPGGRA